MCRLLGVSRSGFYKSMNRVLSNRKLYRKKLFIEIKEIYNESRCLYGSPRIHAKLIDLGYNCSRKLVASIMREFCIFSKIRKSYKRTSIRNNKHKCSENLLKNISDLSRQNQVWVSDITYLKVSGGWKYLTTVMDLYSRKIIGYSFSSGMSVDETVLPAFNSAIVNAGVSPKIFHSDKGSQYSSVRFRNELKRNKVLQSMTSEGNCYDNAYAESFFKTLKSELFQFVGGLPWKRVKNAIFEYIECFYNKKRLHSGINYRTPDEVYYGVNKLKENIA
jgi:transposase InsO family protein